MIDKFLVVSKNWFILVLAERYFSNRVQRYNKIFDRANKKCFFCNFHVTKHIFLKKTDKLVPAA